MVGRPISSGRPPAARCSNYIVSFCIVAALFAEAKGLGMREHGIYTLRILISWPMGLQTLELWIISPFDWWLARTSFTVEPQAIRARLRARLEFR